jgi:uncharacterized protein
MSYNVTHTMDAYLDIETTGLSPEDGVITVIGIHLVDGDSENFVQLVGDDITADHLLTALKGVELIHTYNGSRFDLPFIHARLGVNLEEMYDHGDLMYNCWQSNLYGGLKRVEQALGIPRRLVGVSGFDAIRLWWSYANDYNQQALKTLLEYNREDVINLKVLKIMLADIKRLGA